MIKGLEELKRGMDGWINLSASYFFTRNQSKITTSELMSKIMTSELIISFKLISNHDIELSCFSCGYHHVCGIFKDKI